MNSPQSKLLEVPVYRVVVHENVHEIQCLRWVAACSEKGYCYEVVEGPGVGRRVWCDEMIQETTPMAAVLVRLERAVKDLSTSARWVCHHAINGRDAGSAAMRISMQQGVVTSLLMMLRKTGGAA